MIPRIIFCVAVLLATLIVVVLALFSPVAHRKPARNQARPWLALSLYIQQPHTGSSYNSHSVPSDAGAFIFHRTLTEGPESTSKIIGKAQGIIIPTEQFSHSEFNIIYLTFDKSEYSGSISIQAKKAGDDDKEELTVVGGTGAFAFARGQAVFAQAETQPSGGVGDATYHVKLHLRFPNRSQTIPG